VVIDLDIIFNIITVESQIPCKSEWSKGFQWTGLFYIYLEHIVRVEKDFQASGGQIGQMGKRHPVDKCNSQPILRCLRSPVQSANLLVTT